MLFAYQKIYPPNLRTNENVKIENISRYRDVLCDMIAQSRFFRIDFIEYALCNNIQVTDAQYPFFGAMFRSKHITVELVYNFYALASFLHKN